MRSVFHPASPEKVAAKELQQMRLTLFQSERRLLNAQMQAAYYRDIVAFMEDVASSGLESVVDRRAAPPQPAPDLPAPPLLESATVPIDPVAA